MTNEMKKRITRALWQTWEQCGDDVLSCTGQDSVDRETAFEVAADRIHTVDPEAGDEFYKLNFEEQEKFKMKAFPHAEYC